MQGLNKWQYDFSIEVLGLFLAIKDCLYFLQFGRYGMQQEQRYRNWFDKPFDFLNFNCELVQEYCGNHLAIAFDPSHVSTSGKATPGLGNFWSGVAGKTKRGLEISGKELEKTVFLLQCSTHSSQHGKGLLLVANTKGETRCFFYGRYQDIVPQ